MCPSRTSGQSCIVQSAGAVKPVQVSVAAAVKAVQVKVAAAWSGLPSVAVPSAPLLSEAGRVSLSCVNSAVGEGPPSSAPADTAMVKLWKLGETLLLEV